VVNISRVNTDTFDNCSPAYGLPPANELLGQAGQAGQVTLFKTALKIVTNGTISGDISEISRMI
jgi:hypothetical protein